MKKIYLAFMGILLIVGVSSLNAQTILLSEDFTGSLPSTWTINTPTGASAWTFTTTGSVLLAELASTTGPTGYLMVDSDGAGNDGLAENTELLSPAFSCVGETNVRLQFQELFQQYGTSTGVVAVRVGTGAWNNVYTVGPALAQNTTTPNPNLVDIDISAFVANSANVQVRYTYSGDWDYWWMVDDILVYAPAAFDAAIITAAISEYTAVPLAQVTPYTPTCTVSNQGATTITGISVATTITANSTNTVVYNGTMTQASLASGDTALLTSSTSFTPMAVDFYSVEFIVSINETDGLAANDTFTTAISIEDSLYARDVTFLTGIADGALGIGPGFIGVLGNVIDIAVATNIIGIEGFSASGGLVVGDTVTAKVYNFSGTTVGAQIFTQAKILTIADTSFLSFTFNQALTPGQYFIGLEESISSNFAIMYSSEIYQTNKSQGSVNGGAFVDIESLGFRAVPLVRARLFNPAVCTISDLASGMQSPCVNTTNNYTQDITVTYSTSPATGLLNVNGQTFAITSSPQTVTLSGLASDGAAVNVTAFFSANTACTFTENSLFTAPANCQAVCTISDLASGMQSPCVNTTNNYTQDIIVTYSTPPATGLLNVNGQTFAITSSPQTVTLSGLTSDGAAVNVTAFFSANTACTLTFNSAFTAPVSCLCPTINVNVTTMNNANCSSPNGSATAIATGGAAIVSYAWTPSNFGSGATISGLSSGSYSVVVTDVNGCTGTGSGNVINTAGVNAVVGSVVNPSCNGGGNGQITINASGGTAPISYTWSDQGFPTSIFSRSNLPAGSYTVIVSDGGGCTQNLGPVTLTDPAALTVVLTASTDILCNGGSNGTIDMTVSGGTSPYTNSWTNSTSTNADLSGLEAGTYQLSVVDFNTCPVTTGPLVTITEPAALSINLLGTTDVSCNGGSDGAANVTVSGGTLGYNYNWGAGNSTIEDLSNASAGTYQLVVTDLNLCSETLPSVTIAEPSAITLSLSSTDESSAGANDGTATVVASGGVSPYVSIQWNDANTQTSATATNLSAGVYNVVVIDANGCSETSVNGVVVDLGNGIKTIELDRFQVYPNPATKHVVISFEAATISDYEVVVYNTIGKRIFEDQVTKTQNYSKTLDVSMFAAGIYFIEVNAEAGKISKKLTITK